MNPKYTIILRVYNEGEKLKLSVDSVLNQTFHDWELIVVDDGSEAKTAEIVDEMAERDERIRAIHQKNKGCIAVFLTGLNEAMGEYIAVLDAGDSYESDYLAEAEEILNKRCPEAEIVSFGIREVFPNHDRVFCVTDAPTRFETRTLVKLMEQTMSSYGVAYKVIKRNIINYSDDDIAFYEKIGRSGNYGEDMYLLSPILRGCQYIYISPKPLYIYNYDENSVSHHFPSYTWADAWNRCRLIEFAYNIFSESGYMDGELEEYMQKHAITLMLPAMKWIVRHFVTDKSIQDAFRGNSFYNDIVCGERFRKNRPTVLKNRIAFAGFWLMTRSR